MNVYNIGHEFAYAIIHGDRTGLTDEDDKALTEWLDEVASGLCFITSDDTEKEGICEISNLFSFNLRSIAVYTEN